MKDYYKVLGVDENSDAKTIKKQYRRLAQKHHPDRNQGDLQAEEKFKEVSEAYSTLSDSDKRAQYDMMRKGGPLPFGGGFPDIFSNFFGGHNPFGGNPFPAHQQQSRRKTDPIINLKIPLSELNTDSVKRSFRVKQDVDCVLCQGKGGSKVQRCTACNGLGKLYETHQQGSMFFQNVSMCGGCRGQGKIIENLCTGCNGSGIIHSETIYDIKIDCKKR